MLLNAAHMTDLKL